MHLDKEFKKFHWLVQVLLLVIPICSLITELVIRITALIRKPSVNNIIGLILAIFSAGLLGIIDLVLVLTKHDFLLVD